MTIASAASSAPFASRADPRETIASRLPRPCSSEDRTATNPNPKTIATARKARYNGPTSESAKEWTDSRMLPLVRNVPNVVSANVPTTRPAHHVRSTPRRSASIEVCRNAVAVSHGSRATFSTGSQAQYPPQPSTLYDHRAPKSRPTVRKHHATSVHRRARTIQSSSAGPSISAATTMANGTLNPTNPR